MKRSLLLLIGGSVALWGLVVVPARHLWGDTAVLFSGVAALLSLLPTAVTLVWAGFSRSGTPEGQLAAVMGGTLLRMGVVVGAGMVLYHSVPVFAHPSFWLWVIVFYLATLALEVVLLVRQLPKAGSPSDK